ncbi:16S rRNA methyltransferase [Marinilactibacillus sp. 15R]|uniref:16S rRNA m(2)G 1207 methyltransferase n=1 Tax=Marinilactibacillus piezotolerans TaxID=258723 RepID=A0A1I3WII0_9LACT|nr:MULTISPECIES: class I SAM-dependent methyltransferase [Marinilactibacillus]API88152.1 16S rRNA methyltransferase [Marinilactibacillus sp. 15R]SFK06657.1 16S rRNA m(2)G 1207 methyltransferase [Marinilactibacillus piezotolerans]
MSDHYYTNSPQSKNQPQSWTAELRGYKLAFTTDSGVFSKERVDYGTQVLLNAVELADYPAGKLLDVGCGYGPLGLTLAKLDPSRSVEMVDINERALALAQKNAADNQIENVSIYASSLYENVRHQEFAGVFSNPPIRAGKKTVHAVLEEASLHLKKGGYLTIVIQKKQGAPSAQKKMETVFGNVERISLDSGYWILQSQKK